MAGHSHWKQIKEHKGDADKKRGALFSKLLRAISAAAKTETNPQFNPRLRTAVEKAREYNVPQENIERAISKGHGEETNLEDITMEAYGPAGIALLIQGITDNKNRTIQETKTILKEYDAKWAEPGSVRWSFENKPDSSEELVPKFTQPISDPKDKERLQTLIEALEAHDDIVRVLHNALL